MKAVDLFCGAGGFTLAAKRLGIRVLAAVDSDPHACATYRLNFIEHKKIRPKLYDKDILSLDPQTMLEDLGLKAGDIDIVMGGPPCQGFSTHRFKDTGVDDRRNELLRRYFDFIEALKPKTFIVENVSGLLWQRHEKHLNDFYNLARTAGYEVHEPKILNARNFGVPQNRKRVFILGKRPDVDADFAWPPEVTHFDPKSDEVKEKGKPHWQSAAVVFNTRLDEDDPNNRHMNHSVELVEVFKSTPKNGGSRSQSKRQLPCHKKHDGHKDVYGRIDPKKPGPTVTTGCVNPSRGRFLHPTENHGITVRHAARFQTFPDIFIFSGGLMSTAAQVGNAVPINLGTVVLDALRRGLTRAEKESPNE